MKYHMAAISRLRTEDIAAALGITHEEYLRQLAYWKEQIEKHQQKENDNGN